MQGVNVLAGTIEGKRGSVVQKRRMEVLGPLALPDEQHLGP